MKTHGEGAELVGLHLGRKECQDGEGAANLFVSEGTTSCDRLINVSHSEKQKSLTDWSEPSAPGKLPKFTAP